MKAMFGIIVLSIFLAGVTVYSITELCGKTSDASIDAGRRKVADAERPNPRQRLQQWVNS